MKKKWNFAFKNNAIKLPSSMRKISGGFYMKPSTPPSVNKLEVTLVNGDENAVPYDGTYVVTSEDVENASEGIAIKSAVIGDKVTEVEPMAFNGESEMISVRFTSKVPPVIGDGAFNGTSLIEVIVPKESVEAYKDAEGLEEVSEKIEGDVGSDSHDTTIVKYLSMSNGDIIVKEYDLTEIDPMFFFENRIDGYEVYSVRVGDKVTKLEEPFGMCDSMVECVIGNGIKEIPENIFGRCRKLKYVTVSDDVTKFGERALGGTVVEYFTFPSGTTYIGDYMFGYCSSLKGVRMGDNVTYLGEHSFQGCSSLKEIRLSEGLTSIENTMFGDCTALTEVHIGSQVETIGENAFTGCRSLTHLTLPSSVKELKNNVMNHCNSLESLTIYSVEPPTLGNDPFNNSKEFNLYVPSESVDKYKQASGWSAIASRIYPIG